MQDLFQQVKSALCHPTGSWPAHQVDLQCVLQCALSDFYLSSPFSLLVGDHALGFCKVPRDIFDCNKCYINKVTDKKNELEAFPTIIQLSKAIFSAVWAKQCQKVKRGGQHHLRDFLLKRLENLSNPTWGLTISCPV